MRHEMFGAYVEASWKLFKNFPFTNFYILVVSFDKWKAWVADWLKSLLLKIPLWWIDVCLEISSVYDITYIKRYCWKGLKHIYVLSTLWTKWKTYLVKSTKKCDNSVEIWPLPLGCAEQPFTIWLYSLHFPQDTRFKFNIHKTFRRRLGRPWNVLCMFNLRFVFRTFFTILI